MHSHLRRGGTWLLAVAGMVAGTFVPSMARGQQREAVYVGVKVCGECHEGPAMGDQVSKWIDSKHAQAFVSLTKPEAIAIARISGVPIHPLDSPLCLGCHATGTTAEDWEKDDTFSMKEGVQCEKCHGRGSEHAEAWEQGLAATTKGAKLDNMAAQECVKCHKEKPSHINVLGPTEFDLEKSLAAIAHPIPKGAQAASTPASRVSKYDEYSASLAKIVRQAAGIEDTSAPRYKNPSGMQFRPGTKELYVTCEASYSVAVIDTEKGEKAAEIRVGGQPMDVAFSPDGSRAYVTNRLEDSLSVIDTAKREVIATVAVGDEPHGVRTDSSGKFIYVLNTSSDDVSVLDAATLKEEKRLSASRSPWALALSPDGSKLLATNALSRFVKFRESSVSEVTVIDPESRTVIDRHAIKDTNLLQGIAWHPRGDYAVFLLLRTKNLVPMTRMLQGWTITNGLGILWPDGRVDQVLLDEPGVSFPDPTSIAFTPDGKRVLVTSVGRNCVAVIDMEKLLGMLEKATPQEREKVLPNHLGKATEFVEAVIDTGRAPRGLVMAPDGKAAYVACALDDEIRVIDLASGEESGRIDLGGPEEITKARRGERLFHNANIAFQRQLSCHSCHPDGHVDGLTYDIEADGIGLAPVDNRTLRGILDTGPFKWEGTNPSLARQCGARLSVYFTRIQPFDPEELSDIDHYISTIPRPPNRYRALGAELTEAQRRGKRAFERTRTNDGREIPKGNRCVNCHFPPLFTDREKHSVGEPMMLDNHSTFDVPHLNNIYDSAPYLHNGIADTLEEIWTRYNPNDQHGVTNDMTKDQLNDLIEYLKTL